MMGDGSQLGLCLQVIAAVGCLARIPLPQGALRPIRVKRGSRQPAPARQRAAPQPQPLSGRPGETLQSLRVHGIPIHADRGCISYFWGVKNARRPVFASCRFRWARPPALAEHEHEERRRTAAALWAGALGALPGRHTAAGVCLVRHQRPAGKLHPPLPGLHPRLCTCPQPPSSVLLPPSLLWQKGSILCCLLLLTFDLR